MNLNMLLIQCNFVYFRLKSQPTIARNEGGCCHIVLASNIAESSLTLCRPQHFCAAERDLRGAATIFSSKSVGCNEHVHSKSPLESQEFPKCLYTLNDVHIGMPHSHIFWQTFRNAVTLAATIAQSSLHFVPMTIDNSKMFQ